MKKILQLLLLSLIPTVANAQDAPSCNLFNEDGSFIKHGNWGISSHALVDSSTESISTFVLYISVDATLLSLEIDGKMVDFGSGELSYRIFPEQEITYSSPYFIGTDDSDDTSGIAAAFMARMMEDQLFRSNNPIDVTLSVLGGAELTASGIQGREVVLPIETLDVLGQSLGMIVEGKSESGNVEFLESIDLEGFDGAVQKANELSQSHIASVVEAGACKSASGLAKYVP